jgi:hypothetical protein
LGLNIAADVAKLKNDFGVVVGNTLELANLAHQKGFIQVSD